MKKDDPRTIITPDAFQVAPRLLGTPTAQPWRRLLAMVADLTLIALLARVPGFLLALAVAVVLLRIAIGRKGQEPLARWVRGFLGCFGALALLGTAGIIWLAGSGGPSVSIPLEGRGGERRSLELGLADVAMLGEIRALGEAPSDSAARAAAERLVERALAKGLRPEEVRDLLGEELPAPGVAPDAGGGESRAMRALSLVLADLEARSAGQEKGEAAGMGVMGAGLDELVAAWRDRRAAGDSAGAERARSALARAVAAPELAVRDERIGDLERRSERLRAELAETAVALEEARRPPGLLAVIRGVAEDLGIGLGWSGLYFTAFVVLWKGRTPGKRLLGIRVVRLDGAPIGWWASFERFGGYAASLLTGLLGFCEILWDRNRQALHDKIARTVVVRDPGAPAGAAEPATPKRRGGASAPA